MGFFRHCLLLAAAVLVLAIVGTGLRAGQQDQPKSDPVAGGAPKIEPLDYINRVHVWFSDSQRFGIVCPRLRDPRNPEKPKLLTRDERGITNNTVFRIDGYEYLFGHEIPGVRYVREQGKILKEVPIPGKDRDRSWMSVFESEFGRLRITQQVEIIIGEQTLQFDTVLVKYTLHNRDLKQHKAGLRIMLDTFIGGTDGVPFYVPPTQGKPARFVDKMEVIEQKDSPDFIQALETGDLKDPNATLVLLGLKVKGHEPVDKLVICRWPQNSEARWGGEKPVPGNWAYEPMDKNPNVKDSCLVLYWPEANMKPDEKRELAFTYGLGRVLSDQVPQARITAGDKLRLFPGSRAVTGKPITVAAYVKAAGPDQKVTLTLPAGLSLADGEKAEQAAPAPGSAGYSAVSWRLKTDKPGRYVIEAEGPGIGRATEVIEVRETSLFE